MMSTLLVCFFMMLIPLVGCFLLTAMDVSI